MAPNWSHFSSLAAKLMPCPLQLQQCGSKIDAIKISVCLFSEADAYFSYSFLPQQPDQQIIDILGGLAACYQLVPKGQQGRCQQPSLAGVEC